MSKDQDSFINQENDTWSENSTKKTTKEGEQRDRHMEYQEGSLPNKHYYAHPQAHLSLNRQQEQHDSYAPAQQQSIGLPKGAVPEDAEVSEAMIYLNRIKEEYSDDLVTYDNFLETMRDFKFGKIDADEVCKAVRVLFKDKPHLIDTFNEYLPNHLKFTNEVSRITESINRPYENRMNMHNPQQHQFRRNVYTPSGKMMPPPIPPNSIHPMMHKMGPPPPHMTQPHIPGVHHHPPGMIPNFPPQNMHIHNMGSPMRMPMRDGMKHQLPQFNYNMPNKHEDFEKMKHKQASEFIQKVKKRYADKPTIYKTFVELLQNYQVNQNYDKTRAELKSLLWENTDLIEIFEKDFVPISKTKNTAEKTLFTKIRDALSQKGVFDEFLRALNFYNQKFIKKKELLVMVKPILKSEELVTTFRNFIGFDEKTKKEVQKDLNKYEKIGSYRVVPAEEKNDFQDSIAKEVLNTNYVSCPTFESEDSNYVFLKRNGHEEALFRIEDERSEACLVVERIDFLTMSLENVYMNLNDSELSIRDLGMSPGIIKDVLQNIYEKSAPEILEGILVNPKTAIPIVLKRLYSINKNWRSKLREKKRCWNELVERNYYKALDVAGYSQKSIDKNDLSIKNILSESDKGIYCNISDVMILKNIYSLFATYLKSGQLEAKKTGYKKFFDSTEIIFSLFYQSDVTFKSKVPLYCVFKLIIMLYQRIKEIKSLGLEPLKSSEIAVRMNLQQEVDVADRYKELVFIIGQFLDKTLDASSFEEKVRIITGSKGHKVYNIKKIFAKIEKSIQMAIEDEESARMLDSLSKTLKLPYQILNFPSDAPINLVPETKEDKTFEFSISKGSIRVVESTPCDANDTKVFLNKNIKTNAFCGVMLDDINMCITDESVKPVEDGEMFYLSVDSQLIKK